MYTRCVILLRACARPPPRTFARCLRTRLKLQPRARNICSQLGEVCAENVR